jgi:NADPH:quinone reductase-like Zn-dependent oxidoreductase
MKRRNFLIGLGVILVWTVLPMISVLIASAIAEHFGCKLDEGNSHVCIAFGRDVGDLLYNLFVMGWGFLLTIPSGVIALVVLVVIAYREKRHLDLVSSFHRELMHAIVTTKYGSPDVLQLEYVDKPVPKDDEVLVKVHAASANPLDWHLLRGKPFLVRLMVGGLLKPKHTILGSDIAGRVEAVGGAVRQLRSGDEVFGGKGVGGFAEYVCVPEDRLVLKPAGLSFEAAAAVPAAAVTALQGLRDKGRIQPGQKVLIEGASGGVGTFAVQIAKSFGAEVTGVCSPGNLDMARSLGADPVIDYTREDFTRKGQTYDLIVATNAHHSIFEYKRALSLNGTYVMIGGGASQILQAIFLGPWISMAGRKGMGSLLVKRKREDLIFLKELLDAGKLVPVIDRRYPLSEVAEALRYLEAGHARGKVVITVAGATLDGEGEVHSQPALEVP